MEIYIVRHGQTEENLRKILQGHMPGNLTEEGKTQMHAAAETLAEENVRFRCIVSSDLKRALDSADIIADRLHLPVISMGILRERDWGGYTGIPLSEAREKYRKDGKWVFPDGGAETDDEIFNRAVKALEVLRRQYENDTVIVVTHGQFARNMIAASSGCTYREVAPFMNADIRKLTDAGRRSVPEDINSCPEKHCQVKEI